eukprot:366083-Chlamydomonas_euryale.AAC.24
MPGRWPAAVALYRRWRWRGHRSSRDDPPLCIMHRAQLNALRRAPLACLLAGSPIGRRAAR